MSETKGDIVKTYTYDANGNRTSFVAPSINVNTSYTYDSLGRMLTVSDSAFGTTSYTYDANSNLTSVNNGTTTATMSYDAQNRLVSKFSGANTYTLTYYNDGNVKRVTDSEGTINYTYNETGALASGDGATYKYDIYGNRSEMTKDGSTYRYYYDKNNRLIREADFADNIVSAYRYDNNGNLLERQHMPETTTPTENASATLSVVSAPTFTTDTFTFDVLGRMSSANVNGTTTTYTYDGNGLRQTKNNKQFVYDGVNIVWEGESLATGTTYYRGLELIARSSNHSFARYQTDWHGNIEGYDYDDFGNPTGGNALNPFRYNGEYYDEETGFIYLRARYYDPGVGRFVSEDPIRDGLNWYAYCANDPVNFVDPSGLVIVLSGTEEENAKSFEEIQMLTDDKLHLDPETGIVHIIEQIDGDKVTGTALIREMADLNNDYITKITRNGINPRNGELASTMTDADRFSAWINLNEEEMYKTMTLVDNGDGTTSYENSPSFIVLGHELLHAQHEKNRTFNNDPKAIRFYRDIYGCVVQENETEGMGFYSDEYETVGLGYCLSEYGQVNRDPGSIHPLWVRSTFNSITENTLRAEHGLRRRAAYETKSRLEVEL